MCLWWAAGWLARGGPAGVEAALMFVGIQRTASRQRPGPLGGRGTRALTWFAVLARRPFLLLRLLPLLCCLCLCRPSSSLGGPLSVLLEMTHSNSFEDAPKNVQQESTTCSLFPPTAPLRNGRQHCLPSRPLLPLLPVGNSCRPPPPLCPLFARATLCRPSGFGHWIRRRAPSLCFGPAGGQSRTEPKSRRIIDTAGL